MGWTLKFTEFAAKQFSKMDKTISKKIIAYLKERVVAQENPRTFGEPLAHDKAGLCRYRIGDYRVMCRIQDQDLIVLVVRVGHRKDVYSTKE